MSNTASENIADRLLTLEEDRKDTISKATNMLQLASGAIFPMDMFAIAALKRTLATSEAFIQLVRSENLVCSRALLRTHIDTALRFSAAWLVKDPQKFASEIVSGQRIDKLKDVSGNRLTDAFLVECRSKDAPWLPDVYRTLSGYVHLSASHFHTTLVEFNDETRGFNLAITPTDSGLPNTTWIEMIDCFHEATDCFHVFLDSWCELKVSLKGT